MPKNLAAPNQEILEAALQGLEAQRQKLDDQIAQVRSLLGGRSVGRPAKAAAGSSSGARSEGTQRKRVLSPEARKRIAAAQKKRWAAFRKQQQ